MRRLLRWFTPARLAPITTGIVFAAAFVVSFDALMSLARAAGIREVLTPAYPLLVDALMATGTVAAVALRTAPLRTRAYCWFLIAAGIAVSVLGNARPFPGPRVPSLVGRCQRISGARFVSGCLVAFVGPRASFCTPGWA